MNVRPMFDSTRRHTRIMSDPLLLALGELVRKEISAEKLLRKTVDVLVDLFDADRGTVYLLDAGRQELVSVAAHLPELEEIRVPLDHGVAGHVGRTGEVVNLPFCEADRRFWDEIDSQTGYSTESMLAGPMHGGDGEVIGVVQLLNKTDGLFTAEDEELLERLSGQISRLLEETTLAPKALGAESSDSAGELHLGERFNNIVGRGEAMRDVLRTTHRVASTNATVLIRGESGTGKGLIARAIHHNSDRGDGPFVPIDCTTLPEGLMENELFGHERGAYTGAESRSEGKVDAADGGTLFLDEIGDLPSTLQGKLLTLLQDHTFTRVGSAEREHVDIRIVAATNRDLEDLVAGGEFREDLYYRLRVVQLEMPPLRARGEEDIRSLIHHFVQKASKRHRRHISGVRDDAMQVLLRHPWPGNVRELENCIESAVIFADDEITPSTLSLPHQEATKRVTSLGFDREPTVKTGPPGTVEPFSDEPSLAELEGRYIAWLLERHDGNRSQCARVLGIGRNTLLRKIREYGLE